MVNTSSVSSEEELLQLRNDGKITEGEYQDLLEAMKESQKKNARLDASDEFEPGYSGLTTQKTERQIPGVLWIALVSLGIMVLLKIVLVVRAGPVILLDAALSAALLVGLYIGHKLAFVLTIIFVAVGTILALCQGPAQALVVLVLDCLVLVPVIMCTKFFFPQYGQRPDAR